MRRARLTGVLVLAASLLLAGCGDGSGGGAQSGTATAPAVPDTWPLTGLKVAEGESAAQDHPVVVTKIDNTESSAPQIGLGQADLVVEELVEGGLTRLAAFFYTQLPDKVGPVRSMRASDIGIVSPVGAAVVTSGAAARTIARVTEAGITFFPEGSIGIYRDDSRSAPYNVFADLPQVTSGIDQEPARPQDYLPWGDAADLPAGRPATSIGVTFSGGHTTRWEFRDGRYVNTNSYAAAGDEFPADSVLALRVGIRIANYLDPAGNPVPESKFTGVGRGMLFHNGQGIVVVWRKASLDAPLTLTTANGDLLVPAGHVWIELVPSPAGRLTYQ